MMPYILTMMIMVTSTTNNVSLATITEEYATKQKCETAKELNRTGLTTGKVILATCTER